MRIIKLKNVRKFVVFSDIHLRDPNDDITKLFIKSLKSVPEGTDTIFLLGDIFDFITVSRKFFIDLWKEFFLTCESLKKKGIRIYFAEGNHDFGFEYFNHTLLKKYFDDFGDVAFQFDHATLGKVTLCHGDNIVCPPFYLKFRAVVKSKYFQKILTFLFPGFFLHFIFSKYAKLSRKRDNYRTIQKEMILNYVENFLFRNKEHMCIVSSQKNENIFNQNQTWPNIKTDVLILGHVHVNMDDHIQRNSKKVRILIGPDWFSQPSILTHTCQDEFIRILL
jgi:UDP-2,3-diacylglucosamine hydrolase